LYFNSFLSHVIALIDYTAGVQALCKRSD